MSDRMEDVFRMAGGERAEPAELKSAVVARTWDRTDTALGTLLTVLWLLLLVCSPAIVTATYRALW